MIVEKFEPKIKYSDMVNVLNRRNSCFNGKEKGVDICFLGDSITEGWELGVYFSKYGFLINRGVGGETLQQGGERFGNIAQLKPKLCVIMYGINDICSYLDSVKSGSTTLSHKDFLLLLENCYKKIIADAKASKIDLLICSVMPLGVSDERNDMVIELNTIIKNLCLINNIIYVDYFENVVEADGKTLQDISVGDLIHPSGKGYDIMSIVLSEKLEEYYSKKSKK